MPGMGRYSKRIPNVFQSGIRSGRACAAGETTWLTQSGAAIMLAMPLLLAPTRSPADDNIFDRSELCVGLMTIQKRGCEVETIYRCPMDSGEVFRSETYTADGLDGIELTDMNYDPMIFTDATGEFKATTQKPETWSTHPDDAVRTGKGEFHQVGQLEIFGITKPVRMDGTIVHNPVAFVLDGISFRHFEVSSQAQLPYPMPTIIGTSQVYYDPISGALFEGASEVELLSDEENKIPTVPAQIILPGQTGFGSPSPSFDCEQLSALTTPVVEVTG